jgi:hypothetical protein
MALNTIRNQVDKNNTSYAANHLRPTVVHQPSFANRKTSHTIITLTKTNSTSSKSMQQLEKYRTPVPKPHKTPCMPALHQTFPPRVCTMSVATSATHKSPLDSILKNHTHQTATCTTNRTIFTSSVRSSSHIFLIRLLATFSLAPVRSVS